jgi:hypothetical protein
MLKNDLFNTFIDLRKRTKSGFTVYMVQDQEGMKEEGFEKDMEISLE